MNKRTGCFFNGTPAIKMKKNNIEMKKGMFGQRVARVPIEQ